MAGARTRPQYSKSTNLDFASNDNTTLTSPDKPPSCVSIIFWVVLGDYDADCEIALVSGEKSKYVLPSAITKSILESAVALPALYHRVLA